MFEISLVCFTLELCMNPKCILNPFQILKICQILDIRLPLIQGQVKGILKMIEIYENNYQAINFIANSQTSQKLN
jgi:hypothetical protein